MKYVRKTGKNCGKAYGNNFILQPCLNIDGFKKKKKTPVSDQKYWVEDSPLWKHIRPEKKKKKVVCLSSTACP